MSWTATLKIFWKLNGENLGVFEQISGASVTGHFRTMNSEGAMGPKRTTSDMHVNVFIGDKAPACDSIVVPPILKSALDSRASKQGSPTGHADALAKGVDCKLSQLAACRAQIHTPKPLSSSEFNYVSPCRCLINVCDGVATRTQKETGASRSAPSELLLFNSIPPAWRLTAADIPPAAQLKDVTTFITRFLSPLEQQITAADRCRPFG